MSYGNDPRFLLPGQIPPSPFVNQPSQPPPKPLAALSASEIAQIGPRYFGQTDEPTARMILSQRDSIPQSPPENKPYIGGFDSVPTPIPSSGLGGNDRIRQLNQVIQNSNNDIGISNAIGKLTNQDIERNNQVIQNSNNNIGINNGIDNLANQDIKQKNQVYQNANNQAAIDNATSKFDTMGFIDTAKSKGITSFNILGPSKIGGAFGSQGEILTTTTADKALQDLQKFQDKGIPVKLSYSPVQTENEAIPLAGLGNPLVNTESNIAKSKLPSEYNYFNSIFSGETPTSKPLNYPTFGTGLLTEGITSKNTAKLPSTSFLDVLQFVPIGGEAKVIEKAAEPVIAKGIVKDITSGVLATESKPLLYGVSKVNKNFYDVGIGTEGLGIKVNEKTNEAIKRIQPDLSEYHNIGNTEASQAKEGSSTISNIFIGTGKKGITGIVPRVIDTSVVPQKALIQDFTGNVAKSIPGAKPAPQYGANIFSVDITPKNISILDEAEKSGRITREANIFLTPTSDVAKNTAGYVEAAKNPGILATERKITGRAEPTDIFPKAKIDYKKFFSALGEDIIGKRSKAGAENLKIVSFKEPGTSGYVHYYDPNTIYLNAAAKGKGAFTPENLPDLLSHETLHNAIVSSVGTKASDSLDFLSYKGNTKIQSKLLDLGINPSSLLPEYEPADLLLSGDTAKKNLASYVDKKKSMLDTVFEGQKETEPITTLKETRPELVRGDVLGFFRVESKGFTKPVEGDIGSKGANSYFSELSSQRNKPVKNPIAPEETIPITDFNIPQTTGGRLNKPMRSWNPSSEFGIGGTEESTKPTKTVTQQTSETLSRIFGNAGVETKTTKDYYTGFSPPPSRRSQRETTSYEVISYPKGTEEKLMGKTKQNQGFDILQEFTTKQEQAQRSSTLSKLSQVQKEKQNQGLNILQEFSTKQDEAQRAGTLGKLTSAQNQKEKQGSLLITKQGQETTPLFKFDIITIPKQGQKPVPIQGLITVPVIPTPPPPTRNPPTFLAGGGSTWFGWSGDEPRKKGSKRNNFGLWNTNPENVGEFYTPGTQEYRVSQSSDIFGRNDRAIERANRKTGNQSILNYGTSIVKKGKGKATGKMKNGIFF